LEITVNDPVVPAARFEKNLKVLSTDPEA